MRRPIWRIIAFASFIFAVRPVCAIPSDIEVATWTSKVLMLTLTTNYKALQDHAQRERFEKYYTGQAASGITTFFQELVPIVIKNKLSTNPQPLHPPEVTEKGRMYGGTYWQVTQTFSLASIKKKVWFSVIVVENKDPPLLIQSLSIKLFD